MTTPDASKNILKADKDLRSLAIGPGNWNEVQGRQASYACFFARIRQRGRNEQ